MAEAPPRRLLHPLLRALIYFVAFIVVQITVGLVFFLVAIAKVTAAHAGTPLTAEMAQREVMALAQSPPMFSASVLATAIVVVLMTFGCRILFDGRPFPTLGFQLSPGWRRQLCLGILLGLLFNAAMAGVLVASGNLVIRGLSPSFTVAGLGYGLALFVGVAFLEETAVRGYLLQVLEEWRGLRLAVVISCTVFSLLHVINLFIQKDDATGTLNLGGLGDRYQAAAGLLVILAAGLLLTYAYIVTRQLWLSIGLHFSWNFGMGILLGFPVSNVSIPLPTVLEVRPVGSAMLTGGAFGLEGSALALPAILLLALCVRLLAPWLRAPGVTAAAAPPT